MPFTVHQFLYQRLHLSLVMRKPTFCICENKDADQLRGNQRLCFRYIDSTIPLLSKYEISSLYPSSVAVHPGLCRTRSKTLKTGFLTTRLTYIQKWGSNFDISYNGNRRGNNCWLICFYYVKAQAQNSCGVLVGCLSRLGGNQSTTLNVIYHNVCHTLKFMNLPGTIGHCWCGLRNPRRRPRWLPEINARGVVYDLLY